LDCITGDDDGTIHVTAEKYADKMQIEAYDKDGTYKPHLTCFEVKEPIEAAESVAEANPAFGSGGGKQLYIEGDDQEKLNALGKESEIYFDENRMEKRRDVSTVVDREWIKNENPPKRDEGKKEGAGKEKEASREKKEAAMEGREVGVRAALDMHQRGKEISDVAKGHVDESQLTKMNKEFDKRWQTSSDEREEWISTPHDFGGRIKSAVTENKTAAQSEGTDGWGL